MLFYVLLHLSAFTCIIQSVLALEECTRTQVLINRAHGTIGCYPKANLYDECKFTEQCKSLIPYTYCSITESHGETRSICQCRDGLIATGALDACIPVQKCSHSNLYIQQSENNNQSKTECNANQFCRQGICLCLPNFEVNHLGQCVASLVLESSNNNYNLKMQHKNNGDSKGEQLLSPDVKTESKPSIVILSDDKSDPPAPAFTYQLYMMAGVCILMLVMSLLMLFMFVHLLKKPNRNQLSRRASPTDDATELQQLNVYQPYGNVRPPKYSEIEQAESAVPARVSI